MRSSKINFFLSLLLLPPFFAHAQTPDNSPTFINSPTTNPTITNNPTYTIHNSPHYNTNTTSTINAVGIQMRDFTLKMIEKMQETFSKGNRYYAKHYLQQLIWEYRYKIAATTLLTTYGATTLLLLTDYYYLKEP